MDVAAPFAAFLISAFLCRFKLTQIAVDPSAGPYKNYTVVFLGSDNGHVLKILASTQGANASFSTQLLEDIDVYNPNKSDICPLPSSSFSWSYFLLYPHSTCFFFSTLLCLHQPRPPTRHFVVARCLTLRSHRGCSFFVVFCANSL